MLIPPPGPVYTLAPDIDALTPEQEDALRRNLESLCGRIGGVIVVAVRSSADHHAIQLASALGPLLVLERAPATVY